MISISSYITLTRPHQYVKNLFIFMPLFFVGEITNIDLLTHAAIAFIAFSLSASAVYILNDVRDIEDDRNHPKKKTRPLASGAINVSHAIILMAALFLIGASAMASISLHALYILLVYVAMNIAYSFYLKHVAVIDVTIIAIGFVLRLFVGSAVTNIDLSMWIVTMTFLLAMFLALAKRRDDILIYVETGKLMRKVIDGYNLQFVDIAMSIMASVVVVSYILYTTSTEVINRLQNEYLYLTVLFVIVGIMRYMQIAFVFKDSGSPTKIVFKDSFMQLVLVGWLVTFVWIIY